MARRFTLAEAQSLIPRVDILLREAVSLKSDYQEAEGAIQAGQHLLNVLKKTYPMPRAPLVSSMPFSMTMP